MKLLLVLFTSIFFLSGTPSWEWLDGNEHDFGDIPQYEPISYEFAYVNTGDTPMTIDNIRPACGCTTPDWTDTPVMPGDTSHISIEYDARDGGYFRKMIKVYFHNRRKADRLFIEGFVVAED